MTLSLWEAEWQECSWNQASKSELSIFFYAQLPFFLHRQLSGRQMLSDTAGEGTWCRGESRKVLGDLIRAAQRPRMLLVCLLDALCSRLYLLSKGHF